MSATADELAQRIDADPDPLHGDVTPAVLELIEDRADDARPRDVIEANGPYRPDDPPEDRRRAAERWAEWLDTQVA
jgi:hypothetical protein